LLILVGLVVVGGGAYWWLARPVAEVYVVQRGTAIAAVYGTVKVQPSIRMNVRAFSSGFIRFGKPNGKDLLVLDMEVKEGQVLAKIENPDLVRELTKSDADLKAAEDRFRLGPPSQQALKTTEAVLARLEKLAATQNAPASEVERVRNEVQALRERVKAEQGELDRVVAVVREQNGGLRDRLARCEIKAPMDGVLTASNVLDGEFIHENSNPLTISSKATYLEGLVNEEDVGQLTPKMKAVVRLNAYPQQQFDATLTQILSGADNQQRYTVVLAFDVAPANLMAGMNGEMNIILGKHEQVLIVPTRALLGDRVWVVEGGVIKPRTVQTGLRSLERTEISGGLREGEQVVVADHDLFRLGQWVRALVVTR
jgi:RND family efflux transporter MFP subunit